MRRHLPRFAATALFVNAACMPSYAADHVLSGLSARDPGYLGGVACGFDDWGPTITLPRRSVWLGHFSGGRFTRMAYGHEREWKNEKLCFPSRSSCARWIGANRRAFHHPEGYWTCLPIR
jgi:hypothetical protein